MKAAKTWSLAGLILVAGLSSASCGKDEGTDGGGGHGTVIGGKGGTGGTGGITGRSGSGGNNAGGDDGEPNVATKLGRACVSDKDCVDATAPGLTCITAKETLLADGAPPKGLCTASCTMPQQEGDVDSCRAMGGLCFPFTSGTTDGYCIEGCAFGMPDIGEAKCHSRPEFACYPALLAPFDPAVPCDTTDDCSAGDLCVQGQCELVQPGCLPSCRGDLDCEAGMFCDQSFLNGTCVTEKPPGKALGEPCTLPRANEPDEPDDCIGFCQADANSTTKGHCAATCGLGNECAWNSASKKFDGVCFYGTVLTNETGDVGDFGFCTPTCNCTDECNDPTLACSLLQQGELSTDFKGPGLCFAADPKTPEYNQCNGAGGAGGGAGGESSAGAGGAASGGDGSGGVGGAG